MTKVETFLRKKTTYRCAHAVQEAQDRELLLQTMSLGEATDGAVVAVEGYRHWTQMLFLPQRNHFVGSTKSPYSHDLAIWEEQIQRSRRQANI